MTIGAKYAPGGEQTGEIQYTALHVQAAFDSLVKFGVPPKPATKDAPPESVQLDLYQEQLVFVRDAFRQFLESPSENKALVARLATAKASIQSLINGQEDPNIRPFLNKVLMPPLEVAASAVGGAVGGELNQAWCSEVSDTFKHNLLNRYPFNKTGHDAALQDVADFYRPDAGTVWGFYNSTLKENVRKVGSTYKPVRGVGGVSFQPTLLRFLSRSDDITTSLFSPKAQDPAMQFTIHIRPSPQLTSITFSVDGKSVEYKNGPEEWYPFSWPGDGKKSGASIRVRSTRGQTETLDQDGEWGLFRLMEVGVPQVDRGARVFSVTWRMPSVGADVVIDIRPARTATPFFGVSPGPNSGMLQPFRAAGVVPPRTIGRGAGCSG
jgi:type VI secretion system protein ImpL